MAGNHPFLTQLRAITKLLDDDALATLANKGLLRRAQKDLETTKPAIIATEATFVRLQVGDGVVEVPELVAKSKCNCPATGICRHILGALIYLRDDPEVAALTVPVQGELFAAEATEIPDPAAAAPPPLSAAEVIGSLTDDELLKWAGKALFKKAQKALAVAPQVEIETEPTLMVRFPTRNITCRWIPTGGLLGMVCSCQAETVCEHVVSAVLAFQASLGNRQLVAEQRVLEESSGAPRTRAEVLASVTTVLQEAVALGLARLSQATASRLLTLAVSAHGVDLPRLERLLAGLAQEVQLALRRDAQANTANLLVQIARIEALTTALIRQPLPALIGQHRTSYHDVGQITLVGLGAQWWRSKGGYHGVTLYFWDESTKDWATWSDSRPIGQAGFDPVSRFRADGPWNGCDSPQATSQSVVRLTGAYRNPAGRLSGRASTQALVVGESITAAAPLEKLRERLPCVITQWSDLAPRVRRVFGGGLAGPAANQELVLLLPKQWGPSSYDSLMQELVRPVVDEAGRVLPLWLPFTAESEAAIELLERHNPGEHCAVLGSLRLLTGSVAVQPISLLLPDKIINLNLAQPKKPPASKPAIHKLPAEADEEQLAVAEDSEVIPVASTASPLARLLVTGQAELEAIAENGIVARRDQEMLRGLGKRMEALGLMTCARPLQRLLERLVSSARLTEPAEQQQAAAALLQAYYILRLAGEQETVAAAAATVG